ncbi:MAG: PucR family transcriptional regulator [Coriobacteriales bacterium]|jgi:hypothetical protein
MGNNDHMCQIDDRYSSERISKARGLFYDALLRKSAQGLVDSAAELLGNPVLVSDSSLLMIARSEDHGEQHSYWRKTVELGECSYENYALNRDAIKGAMERRVPIFDRNSSPDGAIIEAGIGSRGDSGGGDSLGFIAVFECDTPMVDEDLLIVELLSESLAVLLSGKPGDQYGGKGAREISLLYKRATSRGKGRSAAAIALADALGIRRSNFYFVLKVGLADIDAAKPPSRYLKPKIEKALGNCCVFLTESELVALVGREDNEEFSSNSQLEVLTSLLEDNGLIAGIGYPFTNLQDFHRADFQAEHALSIGRDFLHDRIVYEYRDIIGIDIAEMLGERCDVLDIVDPRLLQIASYDNDHQTEYLLSLREVVRSNNNVSQACIALNVHRNTLVYRLERIRDLFSLDVRDPNDYAMLSPCISMLVSVARGRIDEEGLGLIVEKMGEEE